VIEIHKAIGVAQFFCGMIGSMLEIQIVNYYSESANIFSPFCFKIIFQFMEKSSSTLQENYNYN